MSELSPREAATAGDDAYLRHWQVDGPVFARTDIGGSLWLPEGMAARLERLRIFAVQDQSLCLITGEPGTGRSTLLRWLAGVIPQTSHEIALLTMVRRETQPGWLAPRLLEALEPGAAAADSGLTADVLARVAVSLDRLIEDGRRLLVLVDSAHLATSAEALGELPALLNLEAHAGGRLSFVLAGSPELALVVAATPDLASRVTMHIQLARLDGPATAAYLAHRCAQARLVMPFDARAVELLHARTGGVLAAVNALAEHALVEAALRGARAVGEEVVRAVLADVALPAAPEPAGGGGVESAGAGPFQPRSAHQTQPPAGGGPPRQAGASSGTGTQVAGDSGGIRLTSLFKTDK